jgi:ferredoxin-NADP reductase/CRP-like cAMP-binding protein
VNLLYNLISNDILAGADEEDYYSFVDVCEQIVFEPKTVFINEGEQDGLAAYVLLEGALQVFTNDSKGKEITLTRVEEVSWIGELALLDGGTGRRKASVRTDGHCRLLKISKTNFRELLSGSVALRERLSSHYRDITQSNIARRSRLFSLFEGNNSEGDLKRGNFEAGDVIWKKGDPADFAFYILWGGVEIDLGDNKKFETITLGPGQCYGEAALSGSGLHKNTVRAVNRLTLLFITKGHLQRHGELGDESQGYLTTSHLTPDMPSGASGIQYISIIDGEETLERQYYTDDGRLLHSSFAFESNVFQINEIVKNNTGSVFSYQWQDDLLGKNRYLSLDKNSRIIEIRSSGDWFQLPKLLEDIINQVTIPSDDFNGFNETGILQSQLVPALQNNNETICYCLNIDQESINNAVSKGCDTLDSLQTRIGCGTVCGGCLPRIKEWFGGQEMLSSTVKRIDQVAGVASFKFYPQTGSYPSPIAGQHLLLEGLIDNRWVSRRYSITSIADTAPFVEVTVKLEPHGVFSCWLFEGETEKKIFRVSEPMGDEIWDQNNCGTVCIVAGIGVTPAINVLRTAISEDYNAPLHIDYSVKERNNAPFIEEIEQAVIDFSWFTCTIRETPVDGRISKTDIGSFTEKFIGAAYHLCGPSVFMASAENTLIEKGVDRSLIKSEAFIHTGTPPDMTETLGKLWTVRRISYSASAIVAMFCFVFFSGIFFQNHLSIGPATPGHEKLNCQDCHSETAGTVRQQLQANTQFLIGTRSKSVPFMFEPVVNGTCTTCHSMEDADHAPFMFLEPRYQSVRDNLGAHTCVACHTEHNQQKVSLENTLFCSSCHQAVSIKNDPLDVSHAVLVKKGQWEICMGCHDYHGNHKFKSPLRLANRISNSEVHDYFKQGSSPYGKRKHSAVIPERKSQ